MLLIAHRGLIEGPDRNLENNPDQIKYALEQGSNCEVDVRYIDGHWFLGHDLPDYQIDLQFLNLPGLWIHAKNVDALYQLGSTKLNYFWHQEDHFTLTSYGYIWTYPERELTPFSIRVMPEWQDPNFETITSTPCFGICSDYVDKIKMIFNHHRPRT